MFKLVLIELRKICFKRSVFIMMIIMLLFNVLNNVLFYTDYDEYGNYKYLYSDELNSEKEILEDEISEYDYNNINDVSKYVDIKTKLDIIYMKEEYDAGTWQYNKINDYLYDDVKLVNFYTYQVKDEKLLNDARIRLDYLKEFFYKDDCGYFISEEKTDLENEVSLLKLQLNGSNEDVQKKLEIEELIKDINNKIEVLDYRLNNNIFYDDSYLNKALSTYVSNLETVSDMEVHLNDLDNASKREYQSIKEDLEKSEYILKNKVNYDKQNNLNYQLRTIVDDYEIFIVIIILMIAGSIVAEEFRDGTVKLLLIKPYSRGKILLSKYFAVIIFMMFVIMYLILIQFLVGGYIFSFSSLDIPVIVYNFNSNEIIEYNVFVYMIIRIITKLPLLIMLITISFSFGVIFNNVITSITVPLFVYIFSSSINYLILQYDISIFKYLVNVNWNFNDYLFGRVGEISGLNLKLSIVIWSSYFLVIMIFTYINFKFKNIRNV